MKVENLKNTLNSAITEGKRFTEVLVLHEEELIKIKEEILV